MNIVIDALQKSYGNSTVLDIEQCEVNSPGIIGLVGNNGAGKTTLFRLMLDLLKADKGKVLVNGINVSESERWKIFTGAYLDESFLIDYLTPEEYFSFIGRICGLTPPEVELRLQRFERFMNGEILGNQKLIRNLSAGNRQKVGIAAAFLNHPQWVILDEPFNFLDPSSQSALKHLLKEYMEEQGAAIIVSSHNLNHTVDISSRVLLLEKGRVIEDLSNVDGEAQERLTAYFDSIVHSSSDE